MATEEPQAPAVPTESKGSNAAPEEMAVDEQPAMAVNGHKKSEEANGHDEAAEKSETDQSAVNKEAVSANSALAEQTLPKGESSPTENGDASAKKGSQEETEKDTPLENGVDNSETEGAAPSTAEESSKEQAAEKATADESPSKDAGPKPSEAKPDSEDKSALDSSATDAMDVDESSDRPAVESSVDQDKDTQETSAISDAPTVASPEQSGQRPADVSKLDIKSSQEDVVMTDRPASPTKVAREREDDAVEEPAAKRARTEDVDEKVGDSMVVASGLSGPPNPAASGAADGVPDDQPITMYQNKQIRHKLASLKKTKAGSHFRSSVEKLWPGLWADYSAKVKNPIDISTFEARFREEKYTTYGQFKADVRLLYDNSLMFNGPSNPVTEAAGTIRDQIFTELPAYSKLEEPAKAEKGKSQPTRHAEPRTATQPRRQSQSKARQPATSPNEKVVKTSAPATPAAANAPAVTIPPNGNGVPTNRRDSTRETGKRPIHPPKNRDIDYPSKGSRKKKTDPEQRFLAEVLTEIMKNKHWQFNQWFLEAVDPVALNIPHYFKIVKKPMDLKKMTEKNDEGNYRSVKDLEKDLALLVSNAVVFNGEQHEVSRAARDLEKYAKGELAKRDSWMEKNYPPEPAGRHASPDSPGSGQDSDDDSEGDAEEEESEAIHTLQTRLNEEQTKLNGMVNAKKPDLTMIEIQQSMVSMLQRKLVEERTKMSNQKPKSKKKPTKSKAKTGGGGGGGASKKASASSAAPAKKSGGGPKKAAPKKRTVGPLEKAVIADGINELDGSTLTKAVEIIKKDTGQNENDDGEMELDIDALSMDALGRLYELIHRAHPGIRQGLEKKPEFRQAVADEKKAAAAAAAAGAQPGKSKKNKPMNKHEQERKIEQLKELKAQLQRQGSGSQEPPTLEGDELGQVDSSEDESDSEEE